MINKSLADLAEILDRLEPDMWLQVEEFAFEKLFGPPGLAAVQAATHLAEQHGCIFLPTQERHAGRFLHDHIKRGGNA
jgi:hypothetical protein